MDPDSIFYQLFSFIPEVRFHSPDAAEVATIVVAALLLVLSGMMSGSEVAYYSLKPSDLEVHRKNKTRIGDLVLAHLDKPDWLLATILISNNFVNVGIVILVAYFSSSVIDFGTASLAKFLFEAFFITSIILFFGEILPKVYASRHGLKFANFMAVPLLIAGKLTKPLAYILVSSTNIVNKRLSSKVSNISMDQLSQALELTANELTEEKDILEGIVKFGNIYVGEIMTPRVDVIDIDVKSVFPKVLSIIVDSGYSRIPVYDETPDNVKGILYVKDLLPHLGKDDSFDWTNVLRPPYYVPETKKINDLLAEFKARKIHMAIVVDEYGGTAGIVTLEDVLEEIVGEISDETDDEEVNYTTMPDGSFLFEGKMLLNDFRKITGIAAEALEDVVGDAETLAGLLLEIKGAIPQKNETIEFGDYHFTIVSADNRRIKKVKFQNKGHRKKISS